MPLAKVTSNILCEHHNSALSPLDAEIVKFQECWITIANQEASRKPIRIRRSGTLIARWLAKTACNLLALDKSDIPESWVRYAFRHDADEPFVYSYSLQGQPLKVDRGHVTAGVFWSEQNSQSLFWLIIVAGFPWIISTINLEQLGPYLVLGADWSPATSDFLLKPRSLELRSTHNKLVGRIRFDWE